MQEVELKIGNIQTKLHCENSEKLINLTEKLSSHIDEIKKNNTNISDTKALLVISLQLMDEIAMLKKSLKELKASFFDQVDNEKRLVSDSYQLIAEEINKNNNIIKKSKIIVIKNKKMLINN